MAQSKYMKASVCRDRKGILLPIIVQYSVFKAIYTVLLAETHSSTNTAQMLKARFTPIMSSIDIPREM